MLFNSAFKLRITVLIFFCMLHQNKSTKYNCTRTAFRKWYFKQLLNSAGSVEAARPLQFGAYKGPAARRMIYQVCRRPRHCGNRDIDLVPSSLLIKESCISIYFEKHWSLHFTCLVKGHTFFSLETIRLQPGILAIGYHGGSHHVTHHFG